MNRDAFFADLGYKPHPAQKLIHASRAPRRIVAAGVRFGKTRAAALEALAEAMEPRENTMIWVVAPTYDLADKVFREVIVLCSEHLRHRIVTLRDHDKRLILRNMSGGISEIRGKSADNPTSLLGEALDFLIVDEAARLKPKVFEAHLVQRLLDRKGGCLLISTPYNKGWYYELYRRGQSDDPDYQSWNFASWDNPYLDRNLIERERERLPARVFAQEYAGSFVEGAGAVFSNVRECATGEFLEPVKGAEYWAGLDLARVSDFSVLVIMDNRQRVVYADRFQLDWSAQVARVHAACSRYNGANILLDSTGVGDPVAEMFMRAGCAVEGYKFTAASRAALVDNLVLMVESRQITLPRPELWPVGTRELTNFTYSVTDSGNIRSSAPSGQNDDAVMALALAAWQRRPDRVRCGYGRYNMHTGGIEWKYLADD